MRSPPPSSTPEVEQPSNARSLCWKLWEAVLNSLLAGLENPKLRTSPSFLMACAAFLKLNDIRVSKGQRSAQSALVNLKDAAEALNTGFGVVTPIKRDGKP